MPVEPSPRPARRSRRSIRCRACRSRRSARRRRPRRSSRPRSPTDAWPRRTSSRTWAARAAAVEAYRSAPTPNVIVLEATADRDQLVAQLDELAEYLRRRHQGHRPRHGQRHRPLPRADARAASANIWCAPFSVGRIRPGRLQPVHARPAPSRSAASSPSIGAKGGVGASTVAHNLAWALAGDLDMADDHRRFRPRLRHRRARLQPGSAAGHRRSGVRARPRRLQSGRPPAVQMRRQPQPARRAGDARPRLRLHRDRVRLGGRRHARLDAVDRARPAARLDRAGRGGCWSPPTR